MNPDISIQIASVISGWPGVSRRQEKTQSVFSVSNTKICWLSSNAVQLFPPLAGVRRLERVGNEVKVIHHRTGRIDVAYHDPQGKLTNIWNYPGFKCSEISLNDALGLIRQAYDVASCQTGQSGFDEQTISKENDARPEAPGTRRKAGRTATDDLVEALETVLTSKAFRFVNNREYLAHVERCVETLGLTDPKISFLFGGLDAMQQDFGSAAQMTRPPHSSLDVSSKDSRLERLQCWLREWEKDGRLPFQEG